MGAALHLATAAAAVAAAHAITEVAPKFARATSYISIATNLEQPSNAGDLALVPSFSTDLPRARLELSDIAKMEFHEAVATWKLQNLLGAIRLFLRSAQKGHEVGELCFRWGQYHELPPADYKQALRWYARGARMNHPACTTMLGKLYMAMGVKDRATDYLKRTARPEGFGGDHGDSLAQWFLAEMSMQAGEIRDAVRWWKRSAENGDVDAMMRLFEVFSEGAVGIPQEAARGQHWLLAAAAHGHQDAIMKVPWSTPDTNMTKAERKWFVEMKDMGWL